MFAMQLSSKDARLCLQHAKHSHLPSRARSSHVRATDTDPAGPSSSEDANGAFEASISPIVDKSFPKTGLFSIADPKQEVRGVNSS